MASFFRRWNRRLRCNGLRFRLVRNLSPWLERVAGVGGTALAAAGVAWACLRWKPSRVEIEGGSMAPTLAPGDWALIVSPSRYEREDVVVVEHPGRPGDEMVKRIVGVPGDQVGDRVLGDDEYWVVGDDGPLDGLPAVRAGARRRAEGEGPDRVPAARTVATGQVAVRRATADTRLSQPRGSRSRPSAWHRRRRGPRRDGRGRLRPRPSRRRTHPSRGRSPPRRRTGRRPAPRSAGRFPDRRTHGPSRSNPGTRRPHPCRGRRRAPGRRRVRRRRACPRCSRACRGIA